MEKFYIRLPRGRRGLHNKKEEENLDPLELSTKLFIRVVIYEGIRIYIKDPKVEHLFLVLEACRTAKVKSEIYVINSEYCTNPLDKMMSINTKVTFIK